MFSVYSLFNSQDNQLYSGITQSEPTTQCNLNVMLM